MIMFLTIIFFVFGLIIGSFLNVVIYRFNTEKSFGGRSACMSCQSQLSWHELIPLVSFIALRGRCKSCKTRISWQYPAVEFITGLVFAMLFLKFQDVFFESALIFAITYAYYATIFSLLVIIAAYDLKHKIIPDALVLFLSVLTFISLFLFNNFVFYPHIPSVLEFLSGILISLPLVCLWFFSKGTWMGLGDGKLALSLGWLLGLTSAFSAVVLAFWFGAIIGITLLLLFKNYTMKSQIPFAPYLILGTLLMFFFELNFLVF